MAKITLDLDVDTKEGMDALKNLSKMAKKSAKKMSDSAKVASSSWSTFKGVLGAQAVVGVFNRMQQAAGMFFDSVVDNTILMETLTTEMTTMTGSAEKAAEVMSSLSDFAATTPFQLEGIARAAKQLIAFGFEVDSITDKMKIIGDVAAGSGSQLSDVALIYGQVAAAGKLTGERLLQFQERAIPIGPAIAETMGIAEESVKDMVSKGKVDLETFETAFKTLTEEGGLFFNSMIDKSETTAGVISTLQDNFSLLAADLGKQFLPQFKIVAKALTKFIADNKKGLVEGFGVGFSKSIKLILKILPELIKGLKLAFITTVSIAEISLRGLEGAIDSVGLAMATLSRLVLATYVGYLKLSNIASQVGNVLSGGLTGGPTAGDQKDLENALDSWREMVKVQESFTESLAKNGEKNVKSFEEMWEAFTAEGKTTDLEKTFNDLIKKLDTVGVKVKEIKKDGKIDISISGDADDSVFNFKAIKDSFTETFSEVSDTVGKFFKDNISANTQKGLVGFAKGFANILKQGMKTQRDNMNNMAMLEEEINIARIHGNAEEEAKLLLEKAELEKKIEAEKNDIAISTLQTGITAVGAAMGPWGEAAAAVVNTFVEFAQDPEALSGLIEGIVEAMPMIIEALVDAMPQIAEALGEAVVPITVAIADAFLQLSLRMPAIIQKAVEGVFTGLKNELKELTNPFSGLVISMEGVIHGFNAVTDVLNGFLVEFPQAIIDSAHRFVDQLVEEIKGSLPSFSVSDGGGSGGWLNPANWETGGIVPGGFPNDSFPANLTSGEEVVSFSDRKSILEDQGIIKSMLSKMMQSQGAPMVVNSEIKINDQVFADLILELDRDNKRIAL